MTNEEALKHLKIEDIDTIIKHYELTLPNKSKVTRLDKEYVLLKFAEEKSVDLTSLIDSEDAQEKKSDEDSEKSGETKKVNKQSDEAVKETGSVLTKSSEHATIDIDEVAEAEKVVSDVVEVVFTDNVKFGGTLYKKSSKALFDFATAKYLESQNLIEKK